MAKNREHEKPLQSESESGEEEQQSSEEESDSEPEPTQVSKKPSSTLPTVKKTQPQSSSKPHHHHQPPSSSSDEEESGSESESDADGPDHNARPIASKPMEDPQKSNNTARKTRSKSNTSDLVTPAKPAPAKLPAEEKETEVKDSKKSKKKKTETEPEPEQENTEKKSSDDPKKALFQRLWSEDDEIVILKGMIDYAAKKKSDPVADLNAFHDFIKKSLHVDVNRTQLQDKIRRLKKKYKNNKSKEKEGKVRTFSKPHEQKAYELSKKIWGSENGGEEVVGSPRSNGSIALRNRGSKRVAENEEAKDVKSVEVGDGERLLLPPPAKKPCPTGVTVEERILRIGEEMFEGDKEWEKLRMIEMEVHMRQLEVRAAQTKLVLDLLKSGADNS